MAPIISLIHRQVSAATEATATAAAGAAAGGAPADAGAPSGSAPAGDGGGGDAGTDKGDEPPVPYLYLGSKSFPCRLSHSPLVALSFRSLAQILAL